LDPSARTRLTPVQRHVNRKATFADRLKKLVAGEIQRKKGVDEPPNALQLQLAGGCDTKKGVCSREETRVEYQENPSKSKHENI